MKKITNSFKTPWTLRAFDALPGNAVSIGVTFTIVLLVIFFAGRALVDGASNTTSDDFRVAITQILLTAYCASAYAYLLMTARATTRELSPVAQDLPGWQMLVDRAGKHPKWVLPLVGAGNFLLIGVTVTNVTTPGLMNPWDWHGWNYDVFWHRVTSVFFVWWIGCFSYVVMAESARLSRLSDDIESLDLLDLRPYQPLVRQGLTNALLVIGMASVLSLLGVEARYMTVLAGFWIAFIMLAWIGLMLPLRGIRKKIRVAKNQELAWCSQSVKASRDALKSGAEAQQSIVEIMAYRAMIENIRSWPFDNPTLVRFALYLMIPLGSWLGGAFVERGLDAILS